METDAMWQTLNFLSIQIILLFVVTSVHTYLGLHVIRRRIVFSDLALDQLAGMGIIVGIAMGINGGSIPSYVISMIAVLIGSFVLAFVRPVKGKVPHEAVIGILYASALTGSFLVVDKVPGGGAYITQSLSGCLLWVNWPLVWVTVAVYAVLAWIHFRFRRQFIRITENPGTVSGEKAWDLFFFISLGIITVLIVPIAGVLLAYGFLMIPAAFATLFTRDWGKALKIGWAAGFLSSVLGLLASYFFHLPYGPTLVISLGIVFLAAVFVKMFSPVLVSG